MANKREYQFMFSKIPMLKMRQGQITFGGSGSVAASSSGTGGVASVTKLATGIYQIKLVDNFNAYLGSKFNFQAGTAGTAVTDGNFVANTLYQIVAVGTTDWGAIGLDSQYGTAVGMPFVASGTGGTGSGTAKVIATNGANISHVEVIQNASALLKNNYPNLNTGTAGVGASIIVRCMASISGTTDGTVTTTNMVAASPASGSILEFEIYFKDSSASSV